MSLKRSGDTNETSQRSTGPTAGGLNEQQTSITSVESTGPMATTSATGSFNTTHTPVHSTESAQKTTSAASSKYGLQAGPVAGIAVGALLAGAVIAGLAFSFLLRRQKKKKAAAVAHQARLPRNEYTARSEKEPSTAARVVLSSIDDMLPQPVADDKIIQDLSKIRDNVKNHVRTYYHSERISAGEIDEAALQDVANDTGISTSLLARSLSDPVTRNDAIRLVVGCTILSRCDGERHASLLPRELAGLAHSIPGKHDSQSVLYSKWKTITAALLPLQARNQTQDGAQIFADVIAKLDAALAPFVTRSADSALRYKNLDMILTRSAAFAILLFSQPGSLRFDFRGRQDALVVFPALLQTVDDRGQVLGHFRVLLEKEIASA
ncbi:hypothetical protein PSPO01_16187 [Paraphaeosphaeria sporulosa]